MRGVILTDGIYQDLVRAVGGWTVGTKKQAVLSRRTAIGGKIHYT